VRTPAERDLLSAWEAAAVEHPLDRALTLLDAAWPGRGRDALAGLSLGARDALLLSLRERLFGTALRAVADCRACGAALEIETTTDGLRALPPPSEPPYDLELDGVTVRFRAADSRDLAAILGCADAATGRRVLLERLILDPPATDLPAAALAAVEERLAEIDPQAEVLLAMTCASCGARWQAPLDILSFVWTEVDRWARGLLGTVDTLARAYGWREADVLALSPRRRQIYVELATS
jgi:hypothetical protein